MPFKCFGIERRIVSDLAQVRARPALIHHCDSQRSPLDLRNTMFEMLVPFEKFKLSHFTLSVH